MSADLNAVWGKLLGVNREVDGLVERVLKATQPTIPIGREIPWYATVEARFDNLPTQYDATVSPNSQGLAGNNVVVSQWTNKSSRVFIREVMFEAYHVHVDRSIGSNHWDARAPNDFQPFQINWRWNFHTSITGRHYADRRVLARAAGRARVGNHLSFRGPLVVEPMETLAFECEYLGGQGQRTLLNDRLGTSVVIAAVISGYREGI